MARPIPAPMALPCRSPYLKAIPWCAATRRAFPLGAMGCAWTKARRACAHSKSAGTMNWPHAPKHWLFEPGAYLVTAGTFQKRPHLGSPERLDFFIESLFKRAAGFGWEMRAWAALSNHYHFVAIAPPDPTTLRRFLGKLHMTTAKQLNDWDGSPGRRLWFEYWDSHITFEKSYLARLNYVHNNPVRHGVVQLAESYRWCSASWFLQNASPAFVPTVKGFKTDKLDIPDDF